VSTKCPNCGHNVRADCFCVLCGRAMQTCPSCGQPAKVSSLFCSYCGWRLTSVSPSQSSSRTGTGLSARVIVREPGFPVREIALNSPEVIIGRDHKAGIAIGLPNRFNPAGLPDISRTHARIVLAGSGHAIVDTSKNGTYLRGQRLPTNQAIPLQEADVIRIGDSFGNSVSFTYHESRQIAAARTQVLSRTILGNQQRVSIGRDPACDIPLLSPVVSRRHAEIQLNSQGGYEIVDMGSANGTFVNGARINRALLTPGDTICVGPFKIRFDPQQLQHFSSVGSIRVDAFSLYKEVHAGKATKTLLRDVSLSVLPREFVAIVGGSGAGKTTLLCALNGAKPASRGRVLVNGDDLYRDFDAYRTNMGYVPQSDTIHSGLSVRKALKYTAQLRLPPDTTTKEIEGRIDHVLQAVEMQPQKDQLISKLSGGQRKRVNIASELIADPNLLFLDEPTSGLDPGLDKKMMRTLNQIADSGRTVVLVTHATNNIIGSCDKVAFLAHGRLVYFGPPDEALNFFNSPDFATIYGQVENPQDAQTAEKRFRASTEYQRNIVKQLPAQQRASPGKSRKRHNGFRPTLWLRQLAILTQRYFDLILNDRFSLLVLLGVMPLIGILLLMIAKSNSLVGDSEEEIQRILSGGSHVYNLTASSQTLLHIMALTVIMLGIFAAAYEIVKERPIYERERMMNLNIGAYLLSKIIVLLFFGAIQCLAFLFVLSLKVQLPTNGVLFSAPVEIYITLLLATLTGICLGLVISAAVKSSDTVVYIMLVVLVFQIVFSGAMFDLPSLAKPLSFLTQTRWAMEALGSTVNMNTLNDLNQMLITEFNKRILTPLTFNINYDSTAGHLIQTWSNLLAFATGFAILAGIILKRQDVH
jgi:ABC-type multidrug transport system ATPase subunit/pSer/pThr/pTyr-binding forkhead associated (FHA) protein